MTDIAASLTVVSLDGTEITAQLNDVALTQARNVMPKPTMDGTGVPKNLTGQQTGTLTCNGQVDTAGFQGLEITWGKKVAVAFSLQMGVLGGDSDGGKYDGNVELAQFDVEASADDAWNFTLSGATDSVEYTPPT